MGDSGLPLPFLQSRCHRITPPKFGGESVPDKQIAFVEATPFFETPFQDLFVGAALFHSINQVSIMHAQKIAAHPICCMRGAKVLVIILV